MSNYRKSVLNNFKFGLFKLKDLPLAYMAGLKVTEFTDNRAVVTIKHNYRTKNPFRSMYFGAQAMAAELATGVLVLEQVDKARPQKVSMLVRKMEAQFTKKATGVIKFSCDDGQKLDAVFKKVLASSEGQVVTLNSVGHNENGDVVSSFAFEWAVRKKS